MIWLIFAAISLIALIILGYPLLFSANRGINRAEGGLAVYRQQLDELAAEVSRGALTEAAAEPSKIEIQRRLLQASKQSEKGAGKAPKRLMSVAIALLIAVPASAFGLYSYLGSPEMPSSPLASRDINKEKGVAAGTDISDLVEKLASRLRDQPDNLDGWILLARTLSRMGRYEEAANTYLKATMIAEQDADLYVGAGENFYFQADGVISDASLKAFSRAFEIDPEHPGARYYLALQEAQVGNEDEALKLWIALFEDSDPSAPFMKIVRGRIEEMAEKTGRDVAAVLASKPSAQIAQSAPQAPTRPMPSQPGPSPEDVEAASEMTAEDRQDMIRSMVARLAGRMEEAPEFDGLMRLGQVYGTLGEFDKSAGAYGRAAELQKDNPKPVTLQAYAYIQKAGKGEPPTKEAVALYRKVLSMDPQTPEALWYIGISEAQSGNKEAALGHWNKLLALAPKDSAFRSNVVRAINSLSGSPQN